MSATTRVVEKTVTFGASYDLDFDAKKKTKNGNGKTLTELFFVDTVFFVIVSVCGLFLEAFPTMTVAVHLSLSTVCALCDLFVGRSRKNDPTLTAFFVFSCTVTGLVDGLFVVQTACRYSESSNDVVTRPSRFGIGVVDLTTLFVLVSTHVVSIGGGVYRACIAHERTGVDVSATLVGATVASASIYVTWIVDLGHELKLRTHLLLFLLILVVTIMDAVLALGRTRFSKTQAWWILSVTLFFVYIVLVLNVTRVFEDVTLGAFGDDLTTHPYDSLCGKLQCVGVVGFLVGLLAARVNKTCPKIEDRGIRGTRIRTPAALNDVEPFASACVALLRQGLVVLPLLCSMVALFGDATPEISRFVLLLYGSSLSLRFWLQSKTVHTWLFVTVASFGLVLDALVGLGIGFGDREVLLKKRGHLETVVVTLVAASSACLSILCLAHSVSQRARLEIQDAKKVK